MRNREQILYNNADNSGNSIPKDILNTLDTTLRSLAYSVSKRCIKEENFERYKDMTVTKITPVYIDDKKTTVDYYLYSVSDYLTGDVYENIRSKNFDGCESSHGYSIGSLVRVYVSNIVYIGLKL